MTAYEAPAKLNLSLSVEPPRSDGLHPLESLVQTIDWCDRLEVEPGEGHDEITPEIEDNLVERALLEMRRSVSVPPLSISVDKDIPMGAGLGGGSSDAAATLRAAADRARPPLPDLVEVAARIGADVPLFLTGGSLLMSGVGEKVEPIEPLSGFAVAVVVPEFGLSTGDVYRRWDELEGPRGWAPSDDELPPMLRGGMPLRNDLLPAALDLEPRLGDFMADVSADWGLPVFMTGSGSGCFGYFPTVEEAGDAASRFGGRGVALRPVGVRRVERAEPDE